MPKIEYNGYTFNLIDQQTIEIQNKTGSTYVNMGSLFDGFFGKYWQYSSYKNAWNITFRGYSRDDDVTTGKSGMISTGGGDDIITAYQYANLGQTHIYAGNEDDVINMAFGIIDDQSRTSNGHHVFGDDSGWFAPHGKDIFNFKNISNVRSVVVGRIDDYDHSRDKIQIDGKTIDFNNLPSNVKVVHYHPPSTNWQGADSQQWLVIDNEIFYALEGFRIDMGGGLHNGKNVEWHFVNYHKSGDPYPDITNSFLQSLKPVTYVDPQNFVPLGFKADGGRIINDKDFEIADVKEVIEKGSTFGDLSKGDLIAGGLNDDVIKSGSGNDFVWGGSGHDTIYGESGNDVLTGNFGNDRIYGGDGNDRMRDESGHSYFNGGDGVDVVEYSSYRSIDNKGIFANLNTGASNLGDTFESIEGLTGSNFANDNLTGSSAANLLNGLRGRDSLYGGDNNDVLRGGRGRDLLSGDSGEDRLFGGGGDDVIYGGDGDDLFVDYFGKNKFIGGDGDDLVSYLNFSWKRTVALRVDLLDGTSNLGDTFTSIENIVGSVKHSNFLTGSIGDNKLLGGDGADRLSGMDGADTLNGGENNDRLFGGAGADILRGGDGDDQVYGGSGNDALFGGNGNNQIRGGGGNDRFFKGSIGASSSGNGEDIFYGGAGHDQFKFGGNNGKTTIGDFKRGEDKIFLIDYIGGMGGLKMQYDNVKDQLMLNYEDGTIILNQVNLLTIDDFVFV